MSEKLQDKLIEKSLASDKDEKDHEICQGHDNHDTSDTDSVEKAMSKLKLATFVSLFFIVA